jgi:hypothetical protein
MVGSAGRLEEALEQYKRSEANGVHRASMHIRNVRNYYVIIVQMSPVFSYFNAGQRQNTRSKDQVIWQWP